MIEPGEKFGFAFEVFDGFPARILIGEHFDHLFDSDRTVSQILVFGQVDRSHTTASDALDDFISFDQ